jgi:predicted PurR-regulated permease PerM
MPAAKEYVKAAACVASVVIVLLAAWFASDVLLLAFAGIILAILLRSAANLIARLLHLGPGLALALTCFLLIAAVGLCCWYVIPRLNDQIDILQHQIPAAWHQLVTSLHQSRWAGQFVDRIQSSGVSYRHFGGTVLSAFSGLASLLGGAVVVLFLSLYFAADPGLYVHGFVKLLPKGAERRGQEVLDTCGTQLRKWLLGKLSMMAFVGVATAVGLWLLDSPLILSLALLAALLDFIPNVGPIISGVPAALIAFTRGPSDALWVIGLYFAVQFVESYVLQPLIQQRAVSLPPSVTLLGQVLIGSLFGSLGLVLATPLTVVALTLTKTVYVQDILRK